MAVLFDVLAVRYWVEFLTTGTVYDGKHGLNFLGLSSTGHLLAATMGGLLCTYYAVKSLRRAHSRPADGA
jgi:hypothetical protein